MYPMARAHATSLRSPVEIKCWETAANADTLATAVIVNNKMSFTSDLGVLCLLPVYVTLSQVHGVCLQVE